METAAKMSQHIKGSGHGQMHGRVKIKITHYCPREKYHVGIREFGEWITVWVQVTQQENSYYTLKVSPAGPVVLDPPHTPLGDWHRVLWQTGCCMFHNKEDASKKTLNALHLLEFVYTAVLSLVT